MKGHTVSNSATPNRLTFNRSWGVSKRGLVYPRFVRPSTWDDYTDPVCILKLTLYGHPDAGGYWERHCHEHLTSVGFVSAPDWRSTYWHLGLQLLLMVYVDGFKVAGPSANFTKAWGLIRQKMETDEPHAVTKWLGCAHLANVGGASVKQIEYNMHPFFELCLESYLALTKSRLIFLNLLRHHFWTSLSLKTLQMIGKRVYYSLRIACKVLMKILYGARLVRFDLLRPIVALASEIITYVTGCYIDS